MAATFSASNLFAKVERPLAIKGKGDIALSTWAFLFSEVVQYCQTKVTNIGELERRSVASEARPQPQHGSRKQQHLLQAIRLRDPRSPLTG